MLHATHIHGLSSQREREYLAGWQRALAELDNFRRRTRADHAAETERARQRLAEPLVALADNFHTAAAALPPELAEHTWVKGVLHIARQLAQLLAELGLTVIDEAGTSFDPRHHEAIAAETSPDQAPGTVLTVHQPGYRLGDRVIRPAKVTVAR